MKKLLAGAILSVLIMGFASHSQGQQLYISNILTVPTSPLECNPFSITVSGNFPCGNTVLDSVNYSIVGNTIVVNVFVTQPFICLPAIIPFSQQVNIPPTPQGTYTITANYIENGNSISSINSSVTIGSCCATDASFTSSKTTVCQGEPVTFLANTTDLIGYNWKVDNAIVSNDTIATYVFGQSGNYTVTLVAIGPSCTDSTSQIITVEDAPAITFSKVFDESCPGAGNGSITAQASGSKPPFTYLWANGDTTAITDSLSPGTYQVVVTNSVGCQDSASASVSSGFPVVANYSYDNTQPICTGDTLLLNNTSSNASDYQWYADGQPFSLDTNALFIPLTPGVVNVKLLATNTPACRDSITYSINTFETPVLAGQTQDPSCPNSFDGYISLTVTGGSPTYSYSWSNGATTDSLPQLGAGVYEVVVSDANGCSATDTFTLVTGPGISVSLTVEDTLICAGDSVNFLGSSPDTGVSFSWYLDNQMVGQGDSLGLVFPDSGFYLIDVIASDGVCVDTASTEIEAAAFPQVFGQVSDESCPGENDGAISLQISGSKPIISYSWSNGASTPGISGLSPGNYSVEVTNSSGCVTIDSFTVEPGDTITANFIYAINQGDAEFNDLSGPNATSWFWDFGDGDTSTQRNPKHTFVASGVYTVCLTAQNAAGCEDQFCDTVMVTLMVGLDELHVNRLNIYPNPGEDWFTVELPFKTPRKVAWTLSDLQGRLIDRNWGHHSAQINLDFGYLQPGIYFLTLEVGGQRYLGKLIKR